MGREPAFCENNNWPGTMHDNAAEEAAKKWLVFERLLSLSATYFQGWAMAAMGEWRDDVGRSKLTCISLECAVR